MSSINAPASTTNTNSLAGPLQLNGVPYAQLPPADQYPNQVRLVSDVGTTGSLWMSSNSVWRPAGGKVILANDIYTFIYPPSGSVANSTGVVTLGTALDNIYPTCYMFFPAGTWSGSAAGFYFVQMTSTTVGTVYLTQYTGGIPTTPVNPTLVTTGAGAYTQTTGAYAVGQSFTIPGGVMGTSGRLYSEGYFSNNTTANNHIVKFTYNGQAPGGLSAGSNGSFVAFGSFMNRNATNAQSNFEWLGSGAPIKTLTSVDSTQNQSFAVNYWLDTATDWIVSQGVIITLDR